jgi:hypothetical protein
MKHTFSLFAILMLVQSAGAGPETPAPRHWAWWAGDQAPLFDQALATAGLDHQRFVFAQEVVQQWTGDTFRVPAFDLYFKNPWNCSPYAREAAASARRNAPSIQEMLVQAQTAMGLRVRDNSYSSALKVYAEAADKEGRQALANALAAIGAGQPAEIAAHPAYQKIPPAANAAAALILRAFKDAESFRRLALVQPLGQAKLDAKDTRDLIYGDLFWGPAQDDDAVLPGDVRFAEVSQTLKTEKVARTVDFPLLAKGANLLALAVDNANQRLHNARNEKPFEMAADFTVETPFGFVRLAGSGNDEHGADGKHGLLTIDLGGNDRYHDGAASADAVDHAVAVIIDVGGDDHYETASSAAWLDRLDNGPAGGKPGFRQETAAEHQPAFGCGLLGYGFLADLGGNDRYVCPIGGLGCGLLGYGVLLDVAGDDTYRGDSGVLGCGLFGAGVHADLAVHDEYRVLHKSLGYGGTFGAGIAVNLGGNDRYLADVKHVKYSWFDDFGTQLTLGLGFGFGRRADMGDGHSWAGGMGLLVDGGAGDDFYQCGIYGIGSAYWYALGICHDDGGNDEYLSDSYSIASPPHFAVGIVIDEAGNDIWRGRSSRCCGFGRDFSIGWFEDAAGDDVYLCSDSAFGIGNLNSLAVCWDRSGNDSWIARSNSFGQPYMESEKVIRDLPINCGLFIDGGGTDRYLKLPEKTVTWDVDPKARLDLESWDFIRDGARKSWRDHIPMPKGTVVQPGSTGAAVDSGK